MLRRLLFLLVPAFIIFWNLGYAPFWNPDEGRYASASYEMAFGLGPNQPDWLVPHLNTITRLNKPPLVYWTTGGAFKIFGVSEWSGRLPSAFAALVVMGLIYVWGARAWSTRAGIGAALVWATAAFPAAMSRTCNTDMLLTAAIALGVFGLFWLIEAATIPERTANIKRGSLLVAGLGMGFALLAKGPVGVALPIAVVGLYVIVANRWKVVPWGACFLALGIGLLIGLPWYFAVEAQRPGFIHHFIFAENLGRFSGKAKFHDKTQPFYYLPILLVGLFPWTPFMLPMLASWREETETAKRSRLFLVLWAAFIVLFFSASGTKLVSYVLPAFPALALLVGSTVARWETIAPRLRGVTVAFSLLVSLILGVAMLGYPKRDKATHNWKVAPGVLLDGKVVKPEDGKPWTTEICALIALGAIVLLMASRRPNGKTMLLSQGAYAALVVVVLVNLAGRISPYEDGSGVISAFTPLLQPEDEVVGYRSFLPATVIYARRPGTFFYFKNTSGLNDDEIEASPYFDTLEEENNLKGWLSKRKNRVFIVVQGLIDEGLRPLVYEWGHNNDFMLYSNRPKPADFTIDTVAPLKRNSLKVHGQPAETVRMNEPRFPRSAPGTNQETLSPEAPTARRTPWKWLLRFGLGLLVLGVIASQRKVGAQIVATLRMVSPWVLVLAVLFYWVGQALCAWKWQRLLGARGVRISLLDCCRFYAAGMFGNLWLPTNVGGDALRSALLHTAAPELGLAGAAASVLVERLTGFAALLFLAAGGLLWRGFSSPSTGGASGWRVIVAALVIIAVLVAGWQLLGRIKHRKIESIRAALSFYLRPEHRAALWFALWVSLVFQISQVLLNIGLAHVTRLPVPDAVFWWLGPLLSLSGLIPVGVGGLGAREAAAVALLKGSNYAVTSGQLVGWSLLWQATVWLSSLPGALWVRGKRH